MEIQELINKCNSISEKIKEIGKINNSDYVIDGIIDVEKYLNAKYRILWILKEANSEGVTWSYLDKFKDNDWLFKCGKSIPTIKRIIYTTYGLLRDSEWNDIPDAKNEKSFEPLQEIALINIKKIPGTNASKDSMIQEACTENKDLLKNQIDTYNPNIIIFGNTLQYFELSNFEGLEQAEKEYTDYGNVFYNTGDKLYIHTWHPAVRGKDFTDKHYVMDIVNIVRSWEKRQL